MFIGIEKSYLFSFFLFGVYICFMKIRSRIYGFVFEGRKTITGSFIGSMKETEEMLAFCKEKRVKSIIETVKMDYINTAFERLEKNDVRYRFVVDVAGSKLDEQ